MTFSVSGIITGILALPSVSLKSCLAATMSLGESGRGWTSLEVGPQVGPHFWVG